MDTKFQDAFDYKVIYVFTIDDEAHKGYLNIGDATLHTKTSIDQLTPDSHELNQAALRRIRAYTNTAGLSPKLLHTELAVRSHKNEDGSVSLQAFRDYQVQNVLKNSGIENQTIGDSTGREWFKIDLNTAKSSINAVKHYYANLSNTKATRYTPIVFRPEQADCIAKVVKPFKKADRFLINAKMHYGKTFVSLEIVKRCQFSKTIILIHRPVVDVGWYENFGKNDTVFSTVWDCVIVDEAHEGTTTALGEDTVKAVFKEGSGTKLLAQ